MRFPLLLITLLAGFTAAAQHSFVARIVADDSKQPLPGATIQLKSLNKAGPREAEPQKATSADAKGIVALNNIPTGDYEIVAYSIQPLPNRVASQNVIFGHGLIDGQPAQVDLLNHLTHLELMRLSTKQK